MIDCRLINDWLIIKDETINDGIYGGYMIDDQLMID